MFDEQLCEQMNCIKQQVILRRPMNANAKQYKRLKRQQMLSSLTLVFRFFVNKMSSKTSTEREGQYRFLVINANNTD